MRTRRSFDLCRAAGAISKVSGNTQDIFAQWLAAIWLGAAHIEHSWANQHWLGAAVDTDLYFDPHVKHDTGEQNGLKGW